VRNTLLTSCSESSILPRAAIVLHIMWGRRLRVIINFARLGILVRAAIPMLFRQAKALATKLARTPRHLRKPGEPRSALGVV